MVARARLAPLRARIPRPTQGSGTRQDSPSHDWRVTRPDKTWSWSTLSKESFPKVDGKPKYLADKRTCVLPVKLQPGKTYAIWANSAKFGNFKDADGRSAVPYLLVFKTKK